MGHPNSHPYPSITFNLPLGSTTTLAEPTRIAGPRRLRWQATMEREDYDRLCKDEGKFEVWSNHTGPEQWLATPFEERATVNASNEDLGGVDLSLFECNTDTTDNQVLLEASIPLPSSPDFTVQFTYRVMYTSGHTHWLGNEGINGKVLVPSVEEDDCLKPGNWTNEGNDAFRWTCVIREPVIVTKLCSDADWNGWAFANESTGSSDISRLIGLTSKSVTGLAAALALLPQANPGACVVYSPVLYTVQNGTLSLEGDKVLLHPGDSEGQLTKLNMYTLTSTWEDHIPSTAGLLDIQNSDFLGISISSQANVGHLHFLPVTGAQSIITLTLSDIASLVPSPSVVMFDSSFQIIHLLPALSPSRRFRIAVGPVGGEILVVPAYSLSASISVAFLLSESGSVAELQANPANYSEHSLSSSQEFSSESSDLNAQSNAESVESSLPTVSQTHPERHSMPTENFLLAVHIFQYLWELLLCTLSLRSSSVGARERITHTPSNMHDTILPPRLAFHVTGNPPLLVTGEDASKLLILVGGKPLHTAPKDVGGGQWLIENTSELEIDHPQRRRIEISLHE